MTHFLADHETATIIAVDLDGHEFSAARDGVATVRLSDGQWLSVLENRLFATEAAAQDAIDARAEEDGEAAARFERLRAAWGA